MTVRRLTLTEFKTQVGVPLSIAERDSLRLLHPGILIVPTPGSAGHYDLTSDQHIGLICLPTLAVEVRPKIPISSVLFLLSYACDAASWFEQQPEFAHDLNLVEMLAIMMARLAQQATRRGLLSGYNSEEESLQGPRGRILFDEQIRRHLGIAPPISVRHDVFSSDVIENRLLLAALVVMDRISLRSAVAKRELSRAQRLFGAVSRLHFAPSAVPAVIFTRLNRHYQPAVSLASLLLRSISLDLGRGSARGSAFLIDMNETFERFVRIAIRTALNVDVSVFPDRPPKAQLDAAGVVPLKPDLCLLQNRRVAWVGDAKYKRLPVGGYRNADLYQILAYTVALNLNEGTLVYAADEGLHAAEHVVVQASKLLRVVALDLSLPPKRVLQEIKSLAHRISATSSRAPLSKASKKFTD